MPEVAQTYALPKDVRDAGVRHWGYHGISYDYISRQVPKFAPARAAGDRRASRRRRQHVRHAGRKERRDDDGLWRDFGLPMATRSGDVPPGALFYLLRRKLFDDASLEKMLYERAGLLGLSGISGDMRVLQESAEPLAVGGGRAFRLCDDANMSAPMPPCSAGWTPSCSPRASARTPPRCARRCARKLAWLGVKLDERGERSGGPRISTPDSRVSVWVIPTNEELMIAQHTLALVRPSST